MFVFFIEPLSIAPGRRPAAFRNDRAIKFPKKTGAVIFFKIFTKDPRCPWDGGFIFTGESPAAGTASRVGSTGGPVNAKGAQFLRRRTASSPEWGMASGAWKSLSDGEKDRGEGK